MPYRTKVFLGLLACLLLIVAGCDQTALDTSLEEDDLSLRNGEIIPGQYIVVLDQTSLGKQVSAVLAEMTTLAGVETEFTYQNTLIGFAGHLSETALADLRTDSRVAYIEEDRMIVLGLCDRNPSHPNCDNGGGGGGGSDPQVTPYGINRVGGPGDGIGSSVCVIDTGVDLDHPDLNVDASKGFNAFTRGKDGQSLDDGNGHGTHVSGTIAALNNSIGVVGVAAGATVVPIKVLSSSGSGSTSGVIAGVDHAVMGVCSVANMSLGGSVSTALDNAVKDAAGNGVKFSLAAGNESDDANNHSPARANGANIYTISAIDSKDEFAYFSNFGNPPVDYAAPGVSILSTYKNGGYATLSGTSMAAPHVAGILLLGNISTSGTAIGDSDGSPDPIAHR